MRSIGGLLIVLGIALGVFGWTYETSVTIEGDYMRRGSEVRPLPESLRKLPPEFRPSDPSRPIFNLNLSANRQAIFLGAAVSSLSGVLLLGFGQVVTTVQGLKRADGPQLRTCPACGEDVRLEARICKHCRTPLEPLGSDETSIKALLQKFAEGTLSDRGEFVRLARHARRYSLDLDTRENGTRATMLHIAAGIGNTELVRTLLAAGADPHTADAKGRAPSDMTQDATIKALLSKGSGGAAG